MHFVEDAVACVFWLAFDEALRDELLFALDLDGDMDVGRAARIGDGLDGAESVFAGGTGEEAPIALEVRISARLAEAARMEIRPFVVHLPDLDDGVADGFAARV